MARSATLNPASMPFFPGGNRSGEEDSEFRGFQRHGNEQDQGSISSLSISPSEYRSIRSSPSPPFDGLPSESNTPSQATKDGASTNHIYQSRPLEGNRYSTMDSRARESSIFGSLDSLREGEDSHFAPTSLGDSPSHARTILTSKLQAHDHPVGMTVPVNNPNSGPLYATGGGGTLSSASPMSSLDPVNLHTELQSQTMDTQLRSSPLIRDILERIGRSEFVAREVQRELVDINRKVNLLLERFTNNSTQPEFNDPFSPNRASVTLSSPPLPGPRPSLGNIAPNQSAPSDDITTISQRLNTLTSSVGQLLAIQTQNMQSVTPVISSHGQLAPGTPQNEVASPLASNPALLGHGLPNRPDLRPSRAPNPPMRTWSTGTLDLPIRSIDTNLTRPDALSRDKRRSVSGLARRDSTGIVEVQGDNHLGRDSGPMVSKWDQLPLAPELLRSLSKFGVGPPNKIQQRALPFLLKGADIIAQAPPTQERIAAYVIPAIQTALANITTRPPNRGPIVVMVSTTVDQATQAQRMIRDLGGSIGVRSALGVGATSASNDLTQELRLLQQNMPHIICGTPQKLHALFTSPGGLSGSEVRFLVLDEVDQLIARNLHEYVYSIVKLLPAPRSRPNGPANQGSNSLNSTSFSTTLDSAVTSAPLITGRRFSTMTPSPEAGSPNNLNIERQTALFSNTVPQDVLNLATAIQLREPVRVLVRRDGNVTQADNVQTARGLRQFYLYLAFTASGGRVEPAAAGGGLGIIGTGRTASSAESMQAREWKLDALADLLDDVDVSQVVVHVGGMTALDAVVYKLASRGLETVPLHGDMAASTKLAALNKFRSTISTISRQPTVKVLIVYDVQVKDISQVPLIINYDLPKAVEEYAHRVAAAVAPNNYSKPGVVVNFVTATGGDVEMLRSIECFYKIKCPEVPMSLRDIV